MEGYQDAQGDRALAAHRGAARDEVVQTGEEKAPQGADSLSPVPMEVIKRTVHRGMWQEDKRQTATAEVVT